MLESVVLDELDRQLVRALQIDPRAPFSRIADVLGVSEQTVARRYRRLRADGYLRVLGLVSLRAAGATEWLVRIGCRPGGARRLADALARREERVRVRLVWRLTRPGSGSGWARPSRLT